jgi:hypothetical protein
MKKTIFTLFMAVFAGAVIFAAESVTLNPTADGFVKQADNTYVGTFENMELSSFSGYVREIFLDFDLTDVTLTPEHATLKLFVNNVSNANPVIIAAYAKTGNAISESLTFTTRPTTNQYKTVDIHASQDSVGKWLYFDFADFIKAQDFSTNKLVYFRIVVIYPATTSTTSPLITIGSIESTNKPQLILNDAPIVGVYEVPYAEIETLYVSVPFTAAGNPIHAFNGAGLLPGMTHVTAGDNMTWRNSSGSYPINLMAKLKCASNVSKLHIWNMNWLFGTSLDDFTVRGVNDVNIYVSTASDDMTTVAYTDSRWEKVTPSDFKLTRATGSTSYGGEAVEISGAENTHWIAFNILSNFAGTNYVGLSEVKIYKTITEEDPGPTTALDINTNVSINIMSVGNDLIVKNLSSGTQVQLYNIQGQLIHNEFAKASDMILNVPSGIYIVRVSGLSLKAIHR